MPWMSLPFNDERAQKLRDKFNIIGIPYLVVIDSKTKKVITERGRKDIQEQGTEIYGEWKKKLASFAA